MRQAAVAAEASQYLVDALQPPPGAIHPALGSKGHAAGNCRRCCFHPRNACTNGYACEFCHYDHEKRKKKNNRNKKKTGSSYDVVQPQMVYPLYCPPDQCVYQGLAPLAPPFTGKSEHRASRRAATLDTH